jgi:trehalose 6-phosphate synthase
MNLVVKEAAVVNERDCALILSRTAGAYNQLSDSVLPVSPLDIAETADQLGEALGMSARERQRRFELARDTVLSDTLADWIVAQLRDAATVHPAPRPVPSPHRHGEGLRRAG